MTQESPRGGLKTTTTGTMRLDSGDLYRILDDYMQQGEWMPETTIRYTIIEEKAELTE